MPRYILIAGSTADIVHILPVADATDIDILWPSLFDGVEVTDPYQELLEYCIDDARYVISNYIRNIDWPEAYIIEPPVRDWYIPRKISCVHSCYKARPLQQDYG